MLVLLAELQCMLNCNRWQRWNTCTGTCTTLTSGIVSGKCKLIFIFSNISVKPFKYVAETPLFELAPLGLLPWPAVLAAGGLGFSLSLLFFMDQNISSALVNTPTNK